jgi:hypothetical protein
LVHLCVAVIDSPAELKNEIWSGVEKLDLAHNQQAYVAIYYANRYLLNVFLFLELPKYI